MGIYTGVNAYSLGNTSFENYVRRRHFNFFFFFAL